LEFSKYVAGLWAKGTLFSLKACRLEKALDCTFSETEYSFSLGLAQNVGSVSSAFMNWKIQQSFFISIKMMSPFSSITTRI